MRRVREDRSGGRIHSRGLRHTLTLYTHVATEILRQVIGPLEPSPTPTP